MADDTLTTKVPAELKARVKAEAENLGKTMGAHARDILQQHFDGQSVEQVREQLAELTAAVEAASTRGGGGDSSAHAEQVAVEVTRLRQQVAELAATIHHALRIIVYQHLQPTQAQYEELQRQFSDLAELWEAKT